MKKNLLLALICTTCAFSLTLEAAESSGWDPSGREAAARSRRYAERKARRELEWLTSWQKSQQEDIDGIEFYNVRKPAEVATLKLLLDGGYALSFVRSQLTHAFHLRADESAEFERMKEQAEREIGDLPEVRAVRVEQENPTWLPWVYQGWRTDYERYVDAHKFALDRLLPAIKMCMFDARYDIITMPAQTAAQNIYRQYESRYEALNDVEKNSTDRSVLVKSMQELAALQTEIWQELNEDEAIVLATTIPTPCNSVSWVKAKFDDLADRLATKMCSQLRTVSLAGMTTEDIAQYASDLNELDRFVWRWPSREDDTHYFKSSYNWSTKRALADEIRALQTEVERERAKHA